MALAPAFIAQAKANMNFQSAISSLATSSKRGAEFTESVVGKLSHILSDSKTLQEMNAALVNQGRKSLLQNQSTPAETALSNTAQADVSAPAPKFSL